MKNRLCALTLGLLGLWGCAVAQAQIALAGITDASGAGAAAGSSFKNGYLMGISEVNAAGGVLGQQLALTQYDTDTTADAVKAAAAKAVAAKPFAILGPVFSSMTASAMSQTGESATPHFTGGEAASLTRKFHPGLLRTSLSQLGSMPRLGALITHGLGARKIGLIWVDNEFGQDGRAVLLPVLKRNGATVTFDGPVKSGQKDFAQTVAALKAAGVDALLLYVNEGEAVGVLKQLTAQGFDKPIVSDGLVAAQKVIDSAGPAADGVLVHMNMSTGVANPSVQAFVSRYVARYGARPDQNSMKGFIAVQTIKAGVEMAGKADPALFLKTIKDKRLEKKSYPELMSSVSYDYFGDLNRESYFAVIQGGSSHIVATLQSSDGGSVTLASGKQIALNSNEFRSEIKASAQPGADKAASQR